MKNVLKLLAVLSLLAASCERDDISADAPACIKNKIADILAESVRNPPASVWQYELDDAIVYYIPAYCCDFPSVLLTSDCEVVCAPDGGFSGAGDGKCPDFFDRRKNGNLIWKDKRQ